MSNEDKRERVTEVGPGMIDHEIVLEVINAYHQAYVKLFTHYLIDQGEGPQKGASPVDLLISLIITSIAGLLQDISEDDLGPKIRAIAESMTAFAGEAEKYQALKGKRSVH